MHILETEPRITAPPLADTGGFLDAAFDVRGPVYAVIPAHAGTRSGETNSSDARHRFGPARYRPESASRCGHVVRVRVTRATLDSRVRGTRVSEDGGANDDGLGVRVGPYRSQSPREGRGYEAPAAGLRRAVLLLVLSVSAASAQTPADSAAVDGARVLLAAPAPNSTDARLERAVYGIEARPFAAVMRGVNDAAYPAFIGAAPVAAAIGLLQGDSVRPAVRIAAAEVGALGATFVLKRVFRRPRPYRAMADIVARDPHHQSGEVSDPNSFPSGHAAAAFAIATSVSLSDGRLAAPVLLWATAVSVSRVWHGVHYPSDVVVGAVLGAGSAAVVHLISPRILGGGDGRSGPIVPFRVVVSL